MKHGELALLLLRQLLQLDGLACRHRQWFFHQYIFAGKQRRFRQAKVRTVWRGDHNQAGVGVLDQAFGIRENPHIRPALCSI